jgi:hypothetical protein
MKNDLALEACRALVQAYRDGEQGSYVDWNDVDHAHELAREALRKKRKVSRK